MGFLFRAVESSCNYQNTGAELSISRLDCNHHDMKEIGACKHKSLAYKLMYYESSEIIYWICQRVS